MFRLTSVLCLIVLVFLASISLADIPELINYQGMLTESDGTTAVEDGTYNLGFKIYGSEFGTDSLWWEYHSGANVTHGLFNVILGSETSLNLPFDTDYWLEIKVGTETMAGRLRFTSVGYAYRASWADSAAIAVSAPTGGGWTDEGAVVRLATSTDKVGIGTTTPDNKVHVVGSESVPLLNVEQNGSFRAVRVYSQNACALWVANAGNHGLRVTNAGGDGIHVENAGNWAGYFNGPGYFRDSVGIGTTSPTQKLDVDGTARLRGISEGSGAMVVVDDNGVLHKSFPSSKRYKRDIERLQIDPKKVFELQTVRFEWKATGQEGVGLIAEEVGQVVPDLVRYNKEGYPDAVKYELLPLYLLEAMKTLRDENDALKKRIEALESK